MKKYFVLLAFLTMGILGMAQTDSGNGSTGKCGPFDFPQYFEPDSAASGAPVPQFKLSTAYPQDTPTLDPKKDLFWVGMDFRQQPEKFASALLDYIWDENAPAKFHPEDNAAQSWYHVPWLHPGFSGRDPLKGLVLTGYNEAKTAHVKQAIPGKTFSITFYNQAGGYTLGQIFCDPQSPNLEKGEFLPGTIFFTLHFTTLDTAYVPYLKNTLSWKAYVDPDARKPTGNREIASLNLIQIDAGVKVDSAATADNDWVFVSWLHNGELDGEEVKDRLVPIGVQWGTDEDAEAGMPLSESWINKAVYKAEGDSTNLIPHVGYGGRLGGPVDPSTVSKHSFLGTLGTAPADNVPAEGASARAVGKQFRLYGNNNPFRGGQVWLDYSHDLYIAMYNFKKNSGLDAGGEYVWFNVPDYDVAKAAEMAPADEDTGPVIDPEEEQRRHWIYFAGFMVLIVGMVALLVLNFMRKPGGRHDGDEA